MVKRTKNFSKPFSKTELNLLIVAKQKRDGLTYEEAYKQIKDEIAVINYNRNKKITSEQINEQKPKFKDEFEKLKYGI